MKCRLCLLEKSLVKTSHIIPDFMYKKLYNENHQFIYTTNDWLKTDRISKRSSGEYDSNILCDTCENDRLSSLESYAKTALYGVGPEKNIPNCTNLHTPEGIIFTKCENIDYTKFKLFLLSVLWRASISTRSFFSEVQLGPHEDIIRQMIFNGDPKAQDDYPILLFKVGEQNSQRARIIAQPRKLRQGARTLYLFVIEGVLFIFNISKYRIPKIISDHSIRPTNELELIYLPDNHVDYWFQKVYGLSNFSEIK